MLSKYGGLLIEHPADQWKECIDILLYNIQEVVLEIFGVLEFVTVSELNIMVRNLL